MVISIAVTTPLWGNLENRERLDRADRDALDGGRRLPRRLPPRREEFPEGLLGRYKLAGQIARVVGVFAAVFFYPAHGLLGPGETNIPFLKGTVVDLGWFYLPFVILVITGSSNAVNLADGLDGLAAGMAAFGAVALGGMCYITGHAKFSQSTFRCPTSPGRGS